MRKSKNLNKRNNSLFYFLIILIICLSMILVLIQISTQTSAKTENVEENPINETQEEIIEEKNPIEDEEIKQLIEETIEENNLTTSNFSFFYYNMDESTYYFYNEDTYFTAASTIKVPIAMVYYDKINSGELTESSSLQYTSGCYEAGAGTTASTYSVGQYIPISFLLKQAIVNSDNTAINILIKGIGYTECRKQIAKYSQDELSSDFYISNITSGAYYYDVLTYLSDNSEDYEELIEYMKQSSGGSYLKKYIEDYDVAHKYGNYNAYVHDYGIVYGEEIYIIGIFTKNVTEAEEFIAQLSLKISNKVNEK